MSDSNWDGPPSGRDNIPPVSLADFLDLKDRVESLARKLADDIGVPVPSRVRYETLMAASRHITHLESENAKLRDVLAAARAQDQWQLDNAGYNIHLAQAVHDAIRAADQSSAEPRCVTCNDTGEVGAVSGYVCSCAVGEKDGGGDNG